VSADLSDQIQDAVDWAIRAISSLGFLLPIGIFLIANLVSGRNKAKRKQQPSTPAQTTPPRVEPRQQVPIPVPVGPFGMFEAFNPEPIADPAPYREDRRDDPYRHEDSSLQWGSAFAANDAEKAGSAFKWGSVFDDAREQTRWGWDETEWGGDYAHKRDAEPKITVG
jgi:hypothetical protein